MSPRGGAMKSGSEFRLVTCYNVSVRVRSRPVELFNSLIAQVGEAIADALVNPQHGRGDDEGKGGYYGIYKYIDRSDKFPGVHIIFQAFKDLLDDVKDSVSRALRSYNRRNAAEGERPDRARVIECVLRELITGNAEIAMGVASWSSRVSLVEGGRGFSRAHLTVKYDLRVRDVNATAYIIFGGLENEGECLARGCEKSRLSRVARGPHGGVLAVRDGKPTPVFSVICLASCKKDLLTVLASSAAL